MRHLRVIGLGAAACAFALDQATKALVLNSATFTSGGGFKLGPHLDLVLIRNTGVSFGLLQNVPLWALLGATTLIVAWFIIWLLRAEQRTTAIALGLIVGGASSNIVDRMRHGAVTDFIDLHWEAWHWPTFNGADAAITAGAVLLLVTMMFESGRMRRKMR